MKEPGFGFGRPLSPAGDGIISAADRKICLDLGSNAMVLALCCVSISPTDSYSSGLFCRMTEIVPSPLEQKINLLSLSLRFRTFARRVWTVGIDPLGRKVALCSCRAQPGRPSGKWVCGPEWIVGHLENRRTAVWDWPFLARNPHSRKQTPEATGRNRYPPLSVAALERRSLGLGMGGHMYESPTIRPDALLHRVL